MRMGWRALLIPALAGLLLIAGSCGPDLRGPGPHALHEHPSGGGAGVEDGDHFPHWTLEGEALRARITAEGMLELPFEAPFLQTGWMMDLDPAHPGWMPWVEVQRADGTWEAPRPLEVTWREGDMLVARMAADTPAGAVRLLDAWGVAWVHVEAAPTVRFDPSAPRAADLPFETGSAPGLRPAPELGQVLQASRLPSFVTTRAAWGARNPDKVCGTAHSPAWITIHHTVTPTRDSVSVEQRLRGIQTFHIDTRGWCDIGYHFLVGQNGRVYQGISDERRTGIHVGGNNTNNVGVSYLGTYTSDIPSDGMFNAGGEIVRWLTDTYRIARTRERIRGHREWGSTECPGNALYPRLQTIIDRANAVGGGTVDPPPPPPPPAVRVDLDVRWVGGTDRLTAGSSAGLIDLLPGETVEADVLLTNRSTVAIRGVELGYAFEAPFLEATTWQIFTDHPALDQRTWTLNSADSEPLNPPRDAMGSQGRLVMHAFSAGETKRVRLVLRALEPSIGRTEHPDVRIWLRNINDAYGVQSSWDTAPATNTLGAMVRDRVALDILSPQAWYFDSVPGHPDDVEGWSADPARVGRLLRNTEGMLAAQAEAAEPTLDSPPWTRIDADRWDELVLRSRSHDGPRTLALWWAGEGEGFDTTRRVTFEAAGDSSIASQRVPLRLHPRWQGTVTRLRLMPHTAAPLGEGNRRWYDVDELFFQQTTGDTTSGHTPPWREAPPAPLLDLEAEPGGEPGPAPPGDPTPLPIDPPPPSSEPPAPPPAPPGTGPVPGPGPDPVPGPGPGTGPVDAPGTDPGPPRATPVPDPPDRGTGGGGTQTVASSAGCHAGPAGGLPARAPALPPLLLLAGMLLGRWRRA